MIEKLDKRQDEFVVAGDADVDARLEVSRDFKTLLCSYKIQMSVMFQKLT